MASGKKNSSGSGSKKGTVRAETKRSFIHRQLVINKSVSDQEIIDNWSAVHPKVELKLKVVRRERTIFDKINAYDQETGLMEFYSSEAGLILDQYQNIERLLGPPSSDWTWPGEHCEVLLRDIIRRHLPPSLGLGKGYVHGIRKKARAIERCPEIDILIYNRELLPPLFVMGEFIIVHPESVVAAIQVKRTLDATTLGAAIENVVGAKRHVLETCRYNGSVTTERMFAAVVSYQEGIQAQDDQKLSQSYQTAISLHISEFHHGALLPDYVGSLSNLFLLFGGPNINQMGYQAFHSSQNKKNVALSMLLFLLIRKIRPYGFHIPAAFPSTMKPIAYFPVWQKRAENNPSP